MAIFFHLNHETSDHINEFAIVYMINPTLRAAVRRDTGWDAPHTGEEQKRSTGTK